MSINLNKLTLKWNYSLVYPFSKYFFEPLEYACKILDVVVQ